MNFEECPICMISITKSYTTPCNHTFCLSCINKLGEQNLNIYCPLCRQIFYIKEFEVSIDMLYKQLNEVINSEESQNLKITPELISVVKYILSKKENNILLNYLLQNPTLQPEFNIVYNDVIIDKKINFIHITDIYTNFALSWLFHKWH
jgi:hypothetical protein